MQQSPVAAKKAFPGFTTAIPVSTTGRKIFFQQYSKEFSTLSDNQKVALIQLFDFIKSDTTIKDLRYVAYILATIKHETADTYNPLEEIGSYEYLEKKYGVSSHFGQFLKNIKKGDGAKYRGRGYILLTGYSNYQKMNVELGLQNTKDDIKKNPVKLLEPVVAYRVCSYGMMTGIFTGRRLSDYINKDTTNYINARQVINGSDKAELIARYAKKFEAILMNSLSAEKNEY